MSYHDSMLVIIYVNVYCILNCYITKSTWIVDKPVVFYLLTATVNLGPYSQKVLAKSQAYVGCIFVQTLSLRLG